MHMASLTGASGWTWGGAWGDEQEEDNEDEGGAVSRTSSKDCLILLVDCTRGMFDSLTSSGDVPFQLCMKCAKSVLLNKIISSERDLMGIVFFGTEKSKNPSDFKHVYILQDLDTPDARRIKEIEELLEVDDYAEFSTKYGHCEDYSLSDVLWTCSTMLATSGSTYSHKRVLLFTNNDDPHATRSDLQRQAKTKAKDLAENGVDIELMHLGSSFNVATFYQDIVFTGDEEDMTLPDPAERFEELLARVRSKEVKKRSMQKIPLSLGPGLEIGVGVYCLVREAKKPSFVRLDKRTNEEMKTQTKTICEDTGTELMPTDIKNYQEFGGEKVIFEREEVAEMKKFAEPGLTLMGFKPRFRLKKHYYVKPANFIYPDEIVVTGSTRLFSALLDRCLSRDVIAICRYIPRTNAPPCFVALVPQKEELDDNNIQVSPPGFHVNFLPFAEEIRKLNYEETPKASNEQIDKAKEIIKKLTFNFQSDAFENPALQKHYRHLEAIALEHEEVEEVEDLTLPNTERIARRAGSLLRGFKDLVYPDGYDPERAGTKRKAGSGGGGAAKRVKSSSDDTVDVEAEARKGNLQKVKVAELKDYLKSAGKKPAGKKQDLIDAVKDHLGIRM